MWANRLLEVNPNYIHLYKKSKKGQVCLLKEEMARNKELEEQVLSAMQSGKDIILEQRIPNNIYKGYAKKYGYTYIIRDFYKPYKEICKYINTDEFTADTLRSWWRKFYPEDAQWELNEL